MINTALVSKCLLTIIKMVILYKEIAVHQIPRESIPVSVQYPQIIDKSIRFFLAEEKQYGVSRYVFQLVYIFVKGS
jgi:hypothetical protein